MVYKNYLSIHMCKRHPDWLIAQNNTQANLRQLWRKVKGHLDEEIRRAQWPNDAIFANNAHMEVQIRQ